MATTAALKRPRAVLLDVGGTLLVEGPHDALAGVAALLREDDFPAEGDARHAAEIARELTAELARVEAEADPAWTVLGWLSGILGPRADLGRAELAFWRAACEFHPMPGAAAALARLASDGTRLACVSNSIFSWRALAAELERWDLLEPIALGVSSADVGVRKPDRRIFDEALGRLGLEASEAWFVGDTWEADVVGAAAAGLRPVWLTETTRAEATPTALRVESWAAFLDTWGAAS